MGKIGLFLLLWITCAFAFVPPMLNDGPFGPTAMIIIVAVGAAATLQAFLFWMLFLVAADSLVEHIAQPIAAAAFAGLALTVALIDLFLRFGFSIENVLQPDPNGYTALSTRYIPIFAAVLVATLNRALMQTVPS